MTYRISLHVGHGDRSGCFCFVVDTFRGAR